MNGYPLEIEIDSLEKALSQLDAFKPIDWKKRRRLHSLFKTSAKGIVHGIKIANIRKRYNDLMESDYTRQLERILGPSIDELESQPRFIVSETFRLWDNVKIQTTLSEMETKDIPLQIPLDEGMDITPNPIKFPEPIAPKINASITIKSKGYQIIPYKRCSQ